MIRKLWNLYFLVCITYNEINLKKEESNEETVGNETTEMSKIIQSAMNSQASKLGSGRPTSAPVGARLQKIVRNGLNFNR